MSFLVISSSSTTRISSLSGVNSEFGGLGSEIMQIGGGTSSGDSVNGSEVR